jgi:hypothetical protein
MKKTRKNEEGINELLSECELDCENMKIGMAKF